jgi:hypothetical protein
MKKNIQSTSNGKMNSVQNVYLWRVQLYNDSQGELKGEFACKLRGTIWVESIQIRWFLRKSDVKAEPREQWPKATKGGHQAQVHSDQMVLMMVRQEAGPHEQWPKDTQI